MQARPNLLILMADQLTAGVLPAYGGKVAKTPHLDALADAGVVFESFYCFALPAAIRLTQLGITSVPRALLEAGEAFGATRWQLLWKVELPSAAPLILAGITQCIMLSLSMVVIGALVGAGGLGVPVVRALGSVQIGMGVEAGFVIVLLDVILDRIMRIKRASR